MRLDKIKLAGFKSFVDPTSIPLPGNLVGVVGPNGCGKSNIIDAVRWVMGESSAKHLRGESMADVIFNGSSTRKPVGMASVELVFDNSDGTAPGEYTQYREISIKRQVTRDGVSVYLLNGSRCRRKDITDIFLGTGLGARSYAIIEQGMISRLIEAKPDELRGVIEEAAGISRYKERRSETETRMRHTQENLDRLLDVRDEVAKHLANLQRQANKAEKYTRLKAEERLLRVQLLGLRWRKYDELLQRHQAVLQDCEDQYRAIIMQDNALIADDTAGKAQREKVQEALHQRQARYYELGADINRLEQAIKHARLTREGLQRERERLQTEQAQMQAQLAHERGQLEEVREELLTLQTALPTARQAESEAESESQAAALAVQASRDEWEAFLGELANLKSQAEVGRVRSRQLAEQQRQAESRRERLANERREIEASLEEAGLDELQEQLGLSEEGQQAIQTRLGQLQASLREQRETAKACQHELNQLRAALHSGQGKISSLELLQQHAMGKDRAAVKQWLSDAELHNASRLAEHLDVSPGWEAAVENVLGIHLQAVCVEDSSRYLPLLHGGQHPETLAFFETQTPAAKPNGSGERLLDCIQTHWNLSPLLGGVYRAGDLHEGREKCKQLALHESVVTPDGAWMGPGWLVLKKPDDGKDGVLKRERDLRELKAQRDDLQRQISQLEQQLAQADEAARQAEAEREQRQAEAQGLAEEASRLQSQLSAAVARHEQAGKRLRQLEWEWDDLEDSLQQIAEEQALAQEGLQTATRGLTVLEQRTQNMAASQQNLQQQAAAKEAASREAHDRVQNLANRCESLSAAESLTRQHLERTEAQWQQTGERLEALTRQMAENDSPIGEEQEDLTGLLAERAVVERELDSLRKQLSASDAGLRKLSEAKLRLERELDAVKQRLEKTKLDYQENEVRRQTVQEQFDEIGVRPQDIVPDMPAEADEKTWQQRVSLLNDEITRLGAINLTALEEYQEQSTRLETLDRQRQDLEESLATLTQAIEKIDRECRNRFKDTFDRINTGIQCMFPKLFGGGQAYLELSERDLLETGVTIMARPPGKRNSSIYLLSGGEKALTAVALVFAIFELNPAPFCLLDEVDAPLDDANVGRFSELVKEMAEKVQFLFISHNKATMEIAQHLAGVTMKEPGVSRIVAVDIAEAVELAAQ